MTESQEFQLTRVLEKKGKTFPAVINGDEKVQDELIKIEITQKCDLMQLQIKGRSKGWVHRHILRVSGSDQSVLGFTLVPSLSHFLACLLKIFTEDTEAFPKEEVP